MRRETLERMRDAMMKVMRKVAKACGSASERAPAPIASIAAFSSSAPRAAARSAEGWNRGRSEAAQNATDDLEYRNHNNKSAPKKFKKGRGGTEQRPRRPSR